VKGAWCGGRHSGGEEREATAPCLSDKGRRAIQEAEEQGRYCLAGLFERVGRGRFVEDEVSKQFSPDSTPAMAGAWRASSSGCSPFRESWGRRSRHLCDLFRMGDGLHVFLSERAPTTEPERSPLRIVQHVPCFSGLPRKAVE